MKRTRLHKKTEPLKKIRILGKVYNVPASLAYYVLDLNQAYKSLHTRLRKDDIHVGDAIPLVELVNNEDIVKVKRKRIRRR